MNTLRKILVLSTLFIVAQTQVARAAEFIDCASQTSIPTAECQALVDLYDSASGADWYHNTGWKVVPDPCLWYGIHCSNGHVDSISLPINLLHGTIPSSIGHLPNLTQLSLYGNSLSGFIPASIGNLNNLAILDLGANELLGPIPAEIGNLSSLTQLYLNSNQLTGIVPFSVAQLAVNNIYLCSFSGNLPGLCIPNTSEYQSLGEDPICSLPLSDACRIAEFPWPMFIPVITRAPSP